MDNKKSYNVSISLFFVLGQLNLRRTAVGMLRQNQGNNQTVQR